MFRASPTPEGQAVLSVVPGREAHRLVGDINTNDGSCDLRQDDGAVALARGDVQHIQAAAKIARQEVAMQMLDLDLAGRRRCQPFSGEFQLLFRALATKSFVHA